MTKVEKKTDDKNACFVLYDLNEKKFVTVSNTANCFERYPAASTFKVPLSVMAFDSKVLQDESTVLKWDGKKGFLPAWDQDHTARSWMKESVVWYSQRLTPKIGAKKIEQYLRGFRYGNEDMSGGLTVAWLTPSAFTGSEMRNSLQISAIEQTYFLINLWSDKLPATIASQQVTKTILPEEESSKSILRGKTGSGFVGSSFDLRVGWYVGYLEMNQHNYVVVSNFVDKESPKDDKSFGGKEAKEMAKQQLSELGLW